MTDIDLHVPVLARVEGEGAMHVEVANGEVADVRLEIYEPPRFFEAFLRGRDYTEPVDITARICGICPAAYQMSASHAIERLCGVTVGGSIRELRRLLYCGEWIESHVLHIGFLHAPDFLGYHSGIAIAADHPELVERLLTLKKTGNEIMEVLGGRPIHPINIRLGGFYRAPTHDDLAALVPQLHEARETCVELIRWTAGFDFPDLSQDYEFVSLRHPDEYPLNEGRIVSNRGLDIDVAEFEEHSIEEHVAHSTALHARLGERGWYHVGPLARWANNYDLLPGPVTDLATDVGIGPVVTNPFRSIVVRALETLWAIDESLRIIDAYEQPPQPCVEVPARAGVGWAATEAPRGLLYHRYEIDAAGSILAAKIVPPTAQNQATIETDLRHFVAAHLDLDHDELQRRCEQTIRNYDPCISCSTHFLRLTVTER
ncbi:MAG: nickel-dependent hydrogenase large subunit [Ilumatobacter sp.]|uniref:Ni/Fe hydrogenase subunit alpha n=1 Tax=Ilumatobacter sp. TaxID=1967498 RepID=UPI00260C3577|nr:nickel-dependent hydrogenase large subunit [Ilumatobacter sp.]MDJ0769979.1 nickel-dependent hydrogenase large subunit [Ilumatobacter sp.]